MKKFAAVFAVVLCLFVASRAEAQMRTPPACTITEAGWFETCGEYDIYAYGTDFCGIAAWPCASVSVYVVNCNNPNDYQAIKAQTNGVGWSVYGGFIVDPDTSYYVYAVAYTGLLPPTPLSVQSDTWTVTPGE